MTTQEKPVRIGVTGHTNITALTAESVGTALREVLASAGRPLVGVSCLARGADQVFARVVLDLGGELEVVLPAADYRERKVKPENREVFEELIERATRVTVGSFAESGRAAYEAASDAMLADVERVVAIWDGQPSGGRGGTGEVVRAARERGIPVEVVWPAGAARA